MSDLIVIQPQVTELTVTEDVNQVIVSSVGVQGAKGDTGAQGPKGDTGDQGPSGVVAVIAPITNSGTSTSANIGLDLSNILNKSSAPWQVAYRSGYWYEQNNGVPITNNAGFQQNRVYCYPLFISTAITIDRLGIECTAASASSVIRLGIYASDSLGIPSTLILDAGTVDTSTTGLKNITISQSLAAGLYYLAYCSQGTATSGTFRAYSSTTGNWNPVASNAQQTTNYATQYHVNGVSGALSNISSPSVGAATNIRTQFRIA